MQDDDMGQGPPAEAVSTPLQNAAQPSQGRWSDELDREDCTRELVALRAFLGDREKEWKEKEEDFKAMKEKYEMATRLIKAKEESIEMMTALLEEERRKIVDTEKKCETERELRRNDKEMWSLEKQHLQACMAAEKRASMVAKQNEEDAELLSHIGTTALELMKGVQDLNDKVGMVRREREANEPQSQPQRPAVVTYASKVTNVADPLTDMAKKKEEEEKRQMNEFQNKGFDMSELKKYMGGKTYQRSSVVAKTFYVTGVAGSPDPAALLKSLHSARGYEDVFLEISRIGSGQYGNIPRYQIWCMPEHEERARHDAQGFKWQIDEEYDPRRPAAASADNEVAKANAISSYAKRMRYVMLANGGCRPEVRNAIEQDARVYKWSELLFTPSRMTVGDGSFQRGRRGPRGRHQHRPAEQSNTGTESQVTPVSRTSANEMSSRTPEVSVPQASTQEGSSPPATSSSPSLRSPSLDALSASPSTTSRARDLSTRSEVPGRPHKQNRHRSPSSTNKFAALAEEEDSMDCDIPAERYEMFNDKLVAIESKSVDPDYLPPDGFDDSDTDDSEETDDNESSVGANTQMDMVLGADTTYETEERVPPSY